MFNSDGNYTLSLSAHHPGALARIRAEVKRNRMKLRLASSPIQERSRTGKDQTPNSRLWDQCHTVRGGKGVERALVGGAYRQRFARVRRVEIAGQVDEIGNRDDAVAI